VVTAYANTHPVDPAPATSTTSRSSDPSRDAWLINQCMLPGAGIVAPCTNPDTRQVRAVLPAGAACPDLTFAFRLARDVELCLSGRPYSG
jgi:hypothetical protein